MLSDPKYIILNAIDGISVTKDDDFTVASLIFLDEGGPERLKYLFYAQDYDAVITVGKHRTRSQRPIQDVPVHYRMGFEVTVSTVDKYDALWNILCTATKMQYKIREELRDAVAAAAQSVRFAMPQYTMMITEERENMRRIAGIDKLWETPYIIWYTTGGP